MKIVFLERNSLGNDIDLSQFEKLGEVVMYDLSTALDTPEKVRDADIIVVNKVPMNEQTLKDAPNVKMIAITATGYNIIDKAYTDSRGIAVANVGGYSTDRAGVWMRRDLLFHVGKKHRQRVRVGYIGRAASAFRYCFHSRAFK